MLGTLIEKFVEIGCRIIKIIQQFYYHYALANPGRINCIITALN